jgi:hypothetical protein
VPDFTALAAFKACAFGSAFFETSPAKNYWHSHISCNKNLKTSYFLHTQVTLTKKNIIYSLNSTKMNLSQKRNHITRNLWSTDILRLGILAPTHTLNELCHFLKN